MTQIKFPFSKKKNGWKQATTPGKYSYDISQFSYDKETKTFHGREGRIWDIGYPNAFPSGKQQFNIYNPHTGNFRRFRLLSESSDAYRFSSEDNEFYCEVKKTVTLVDLAKNILRF